MLLRMRMIPLQFSAHAVSIILTLSIATLGACSDQEAGQRGEDTSIGDSGDSESDSSGADTTDPSGDTGDVADTADVADGPTVIEIISPVPGGERLEGSVIVEVVPVGMTERKCELIRIKLNDLTIFQDTKLPTSFVLDTKQHPDGALKLLAYAQCGFDQGTHEITVQSFNPPVRFIEVTPQKREVQDGQVVSAVLKMEGPQDMVISADFSAMDSGFDPAYVTSYPIGAGSYSVSYVLSADNTRDDGVYTVPLEANAGIWDVTYNQLTFVLQNQPKIPIRVPSGIYVDAHLPQPTTFDMATPAVDAANSSIVTGGSARLEIDLDGSNLSEVAGLIVGLEGFDGYFQVPLDNPRGPIEVDFLMRAYASWEYPPGLLPIRVALRDRRGNVSPYSAYLFNVVAVGSGDIQVSVSWDSPTDVDLHVIEPGGCEIYYGNRTCSSGAELDLDSNAGCGLDNVNNENVFWPDGGAPSGEYTVKVAYWSDCSHPRDTSYVVTVNACGRTDVYEGDFAPGSSTGGGSGTGELVTTFSNTNCQTTIRGRIRYEDRTFDETGFGATSWQPIRGARIELRQLQGGAVVATGVTDQNGDYEIGFSNEGPPGLVVVVQAQTDATSGLRDIKILDHPKFKKLYEVASPPIVFDPTQEVLIHDIDINQALNAGAFNIFDVMQRGYDLVRLMTGRELGELVGFWKTGTDTTETLFCSQFLYDTGVCTDLLSVSVQGKETDRDEYDDMVILKEFFRFALTQTSRDDHPGGAIDYTRDVPKRAWTEGVTSFFAADVLGTRYFVNSRPHGTYIVDDYEAMLSPFGFDTESDLGVENVSPFLVGAVLWDIADAQDSETVDQLAGRAGVYDALFSYLPSDNYVDRGGAGVDLSDFLDGWFCRDWAKRAEIGSILNLRGYVYDFAGPTGCGAP